MTGQNQPSSETTTPTENDPHRQPVTPGRSWSSIAVESGMQYNGEVKEDLPAPTEEREVPPDEGEAQPAEEVETPEEQEPITAEAEDDAPPAPSEGNEGNTDEVATISELVQTSELDPDWFQGLGVDVTVNGETSQVPFRDLVANYQMNQAADAKLEQAKTKASEAQQEVANKTAALEAQFQAAGAIIQEAEKVLQADFATIDWKALHDEDPGEWSAQKVAFNERRGQLEALKQSLIMQHQQSVQQRQQEMQQHHSAYLQEQMQLLHQEMPKVSPDWSNPDTQPAAKARLSDFLLRQGFTQDDINNAADHRLLVIAEKARLYDEGKGKLEVSKKRLRTVPKVVKPGTPKPVGTVQTEQLKKAQARLSKSGHLDDALEVLRQRRKAG